MADQRENPLDVTFIGSLREEPEIVGQVRELDKRITSAQDARASWQTKQEKLLRQRTGVRKQKLFPWPGASNHNWPLMDKVIRRWKPSMAALIAGSDPVTYFRAMRPEGVQKSPSAQEYYHYKFWRMAGVDETILELLEYIAQFGKGYTRQGWEYRTAKQCRIIFADKLFPEGIDAAVEQYNMRIEQMRTELEDAIQTGKAPESARAQIPAPVDNRTLVEQTLEDEYNLNRDNVLELAQLRQAADKLLEGADKVKIYYRVVQRDMPSWAAINPMDVVVPPRSRNIDDAEFVAIRHRLSTDDLMRMAADGQFDPEAAYAVVTKIQQRAIGDSEKNVSFDGVGAAAYSNIVDVLDKSEGVDSGDVDDKDVELFWEVYCFLDIDGDGIRERCVLWYHPQMRDTDSSDPQFGGTILALYPFPYPFDEWPITRFEFEHKSNRPYGSRGIAEHLSVHQATTNKMHNSRLDAIAIVLAPMFQYRSAAGDIPQNVKYLPGQMIPVQVVGDIMPVQSDASKLIQFLAEENYTRRDAEDYIGLFDASVLAETATERRTASEVNAILQQQQSIFGQDARLLQKGMRRVHRQLWNLIEEFGPDEEYITVTGEEAPRLVKKANIVDDYDITPAGTPANTSQQLAMAKAREGLQIFANDLTGLINKHELYRWYFNVMDRNMGKLIVRPPEQAALIQQMQQTVAQLGQEPAPPP